MMIRDLTCPVCSADLPLAGDERPGDEVYCSCCGSPGKITGNARDENCDVEEDF
jgi:predicted amidophosphoribosyltransferase